VRKANGDGNENDNAIMVLKHRKRREIILYNHTNGIGKPRTNKMTGLMVEYETLFCAKIEVHSHTANVLRRTLMPEPTKMTILTEEEYLRAEEKADIRHEYVNGHVFAMSGATEAHNVICVNILSSIHSYLRGSQCRAYINDMKVKIKRAKSYYYPDIMVTCEPFESKSVFKAAPVLIVEVLSPSTTQVDKREKLVAYQKIASLKEYLIVYQDRQRVDLYRRVSNDDWEVLILGSDDELVLQWLPKGPLHLPFSLIYEGYNPPCIVKESESEYRFGYESGFEDDESLN
jgi:Uma2 family endonuclease